MTLPSPIERWLYRLLLWTIYVLPLTLPHRFNRLIWEWQPPEETHLWYEFRGVVVYLFDAPLFLFLIVSLLLLLFSSALRWQWIGCTRMIIVQHGGFWWVLLLLWMSGSIVWSIEPMLSIYFVGRSLLGFYVALWLAVLIYQGAAVSLLRSIVVAGSLHALIAILQMLKRAPLGWTWLGEYQPAPYNPWGFGYQSLQGYGLAIHPNNLAGYLLVALFAVLVLMRHNWLRTGWLAWLEYLALVIISGGLLATASRTAILAAGIGVALGMIFVPPSFLRKGRVVFALFAFFLIAAIIFSITTSFMSRFTALIGENFFTRFTFAFADTVVVIREHPILGVGHGNLMMRIAELRTGSPGLLLPAHNVLYIIRAELGLVGLFLFLAMMTNIFLRLRRDNAGGLLLWGCCLAALIIVGLLDFYLWSEARSHLLLWLVFGLWWGYSLLHSVGN
jgi:hypothetical protein